MRRRAKLYEADVYRFEHDRPEDLSDVKHTRESTFRWVRAVYTLVHETV